MTNGAPGGGPRLLVVEGPIGVGKTTLAARLAESLQLPAVLEQSGENPFLEDFYAKPGGGVALATQLHFLVRRIALRAELRKNPASGRSGAVLDFLLEKDRLFAELNLDAREFKLYQHIAEVLVPPPLRPDLVIYLQAPTDTLAKRVTRRGHAFERGLRLDYLERVNANYVEFFHHYAEAPLLIVNTSEFHLHEREEDFQLLLEHARRGGIRRRYLNAGSA